MADDIQTLKQTGELPSAAETDAAFTQAFSNPTPPSLEPQGPAPAAMPIAPQGPVNVLNPDGKLVSIPGEQLQDALASGYSPATQEHVDNYVKEQTYGTPSQKLITGLEGAASALTFGASTSAEQSLLGQSPEDIRNRREINPGSHMLGEAGSLLTGQAEAKALAKAGEAAAALTGLSEAATPLAKIGSAIVKGAVENAAFQAGDENSKRASEMLSKDPSQAVETAMSDIGLSGLIGGAIGGAFGSISPLWKATLGSKTSGLLHATAQRLGGIEGEIVSTPVEDALQKTGLADSISPEIRAGLSQDPAIKNLTSTLEQSDTTASGREFQKSAEKFRNDVSDVQAHALGLEPGSIPAKGEIDRYTAGKAIGDSLADELDTTIKPLSEGYEAVKAKFAGADLTPSVAERAGEAAQAEGKALGGVSKAQKELAAAQRELKASMEATNPSAAIEAEARVSEAQAKVLQAEQAVADVQKANRAPGTVDTLVDKISQAANREGWTASPSSEIMTEVNRVLKELPNLKTLKQLSQYIQQVGENTSSKLPFGQQTPVSRAGMIIKGILRDAEGEILGRHIGSEEGAEALANYAKLRKDYAAAANLKDQVAASLGLKASTTGYAKALRAMALSDGEKVLGRLDGKGDAAWLDLVQSRFPKTAKLIKDHQIEALAAAAREGDKLSSKKLLAAMDKMSPQARAFVLGPEAEGKIKAAHSLLEQFADKNHNFSNTARTHDKLMSGISASAIGLITAVASHSGPMGLLAGSLAKALGRDVPDAARLGLLKFLGSSQKIDGEGFKTMVDLIQHTIRGENLAGKAAANVFKVGREVLPQSAMPTEADLRKLDKKLKELKSEQKPLTEVGGKTGYYLPEHGAALGKTAAVAVQYLNSLRPNTDRSSPLDPKPVASKMAQQTFDRALTIGQQPLVVMDHIQKGTLTSQDVTAIKTMYPALYSSLNQKLMGQLVEQQDSDKPLPYSTRLCLSLFMGQALDSTMKPASILAAQPAPTQAPQQGGGSKPPSASSTKGIAKLPGAYQTASQSREQRAQKS